MIIGTAFGAAIGFGLAYGGGNTVSHYGGDITNGAKSVGHFFSRRRPVMRRLFQLQRLDRYPPQQRRKALLSGLIITTLSAFLAWVGTAGVVLLLIVGGSGVLFFGPLTVYVNSELLRIRG
jgi:hypothetical protein